MAAVSSQPATVAPASLQIRLADLAGDKFKDMFYAIFDSHRNVSSIIHTSIIQSINSSINQQNAWIMKESAELQLCDWFCSMFSLLSNQCAYLCLSCPHHQAITIQPFSILMISHNNHVMDKVVSWVSDVLRACDVCRSIIFNLAHEISHKPVNQSSSLTHWYQHSCAQPINCVKLMSNCGCGISFTIQPSVNASIAHSHYMENFHFPYSMRKSFHSDNLINNQPFIPSYIIFVSIVQITHWSINWLIVFL